MEKLNILKFPEKRKILTTLMKSFLIWSPKRVKIGVTLSLPMYPMIGMRLISRGHEDESTGAGEQCGDGWMIVGTVVDMVSTGSVVMVGADTMTTATAEARMVTVAMVEARMLAVVAVAAETGLTTSCFGVTWTRDLGAVTWARDPEQEAVTTAAMGQLTSTTVMSARRCLEPRSASTLMSKSTE